MRHQRTPSLLHLALAGVFAIASFTSSAFAQPGPSGQWSELARLDTKTRDLVVTWLGTDCEAASERRLIDELTNLGASLVPVFREAYRLGPPPERVAQTRAAARAAFEQRQAWLRAEGTESMGAEETQRLLGTPPDDYLGRRTRNADRGWRQRALIALGAVGGENVRAELTTLAVDAANPDAAAAKRGLAEGGNEGP